MRTPILSVLLLLLTLSAFGQEQRGIRKVWNDFFNDTTTAAKPKFVIYPLVAYAPETSWEFGVSSLFVYNAKNDLRNRLSEVSVLAFATLENQYGLWADHAIYTDKDAYFFLGKFRLQEFPLLYYGIGSDTPDEAVAIINGFAITWRERLLRKIRENFYVGLELDLNHLAGVEVSEQTAEYRAVPGVEGFTNFGVGLGLVYDQRYNVLNPRGGVFAEGGFLRYDENWGSDYSFYSYFLDFRYYHPTGKNQILAYQLLANSVSSFNQSDIPFNQLSLMGGESLMRGYYLGRYRDNSYIATQAEYRFLPFPFKKPILKRLGGTVFGGIGAVSPGPLELNWDQIKVSGGLGLRYLLFPGKDIYTRFDVAFTEEGIGYYLFVGEAF